MRGQIRDISIDYETRKPVVSFLVDGIEDLEELKDKELDITVKKHRNRRSRDANSMLWACLKDMAQVLPGETKDSLYLKMLDRYGVFEPVLVYPDAVDSLRREWRYVREECSVATEKGMMTQCLCYFGSHTYDSKEFSVLLDGVVSEMREIGLTPPPTEEMQQAIKEWEDMRKK